MRIGKWTVRWNGGLTLTFEDWSAYRIDRAAIIERYQFFPGQVIDLNKPCDAAYICRHGSHLDEVCILCGRLR